MKTLLSLLFFTVVSSVSQASSYEIHLNLTTYHFFENCQVASRFSLKGYDCGRGITNPILGIQDTETGYRSLLGLNSIGEMMVGASKTYSSGLVLGGYIQDGDRYEDRGLRSLKLFKINSLDFVPIIGYNMGLYEGRDMGLSATITPALALVYLSFKMR